MSFESFETLYDILDLRPDASPQEIREAYMKAKSAYTKDSLALYTLITTEEREEMLRRIERAYEVLSNPDRRREYDQHHGSLTDPLESPFVTRASPVVSIDRVPPMESSANPDELLVPPSTAIEPPPMPGRTHLPPPEASRVLPPPPPIAPSWESVVGATPEEWSGAMIRTLREARRISLEELSSATKISKTYLTAIEDELFAKLPAPVFVRGFVTQVAKALKLPAETVAASYMNRYHLSGVHAKN